MRAVNKVLTATPNAHASLVAASYVYQKWKADQERKKGEGIPAAPASNTGAEDLGLSMDTSATKRRRGRKSLWIGSGSGSATGGGTSTGMGLSL